MKKANRTDRTPKPLTPREQLNNWKNSQKHRYTEAPMQYPRIVADCTEVIDADTLYNKAVAITTKAILTNYAKSGNAKMRELYWSCVEFAHGFKDDGNGGCDLIQETALYLWGYHGKLLTDTTGDGQKDKDGNPITILRGAFRNIRKYIYGHEQRQYKQVYITDYEGNHGEIIAPDEWGIDDYETLVTVQSVIESMNLTKVQSDILSLRMRGKSIHECAEIRGKSRQAVIKTMGQIRTKYIDLYGLPENVIE